MIEEMMKVFKVGDLISLGNWTVAEIVELTEVNGQPHARCEFVYTTAADKSSFEYYGGVIPAMMLESHAIQLSVEEYCARVGISKSAFVPAAPWLE